ncbi:MAG: hypothetical protein NC906_04875 [Candidatus Omnitrophica bacterium]|nr:hypothetical protein [Candidatus Omnitrophota bacterium]
MRKHNLSVLTCFTVFVAICDGIEINNDIASQRLTKNKGEVVQVDTGHYFFSIKDAEGTETKFFAPMSHLKKLNAGENIQVSYKKTTDGNLKALGIKPIKKKKRVQ